MNKTLEEVEKIVSTFPIKKSSDLDDKPKLTKPSKGRPRRRVHCVQCKYYGYASDICRLELEYPMRRCATKNRNKDCVDYEPK